MTDSTFQLLAIGLYFAAMIAIGVYAYRPQALRDYATWPIGPLEKLEGLEQLRFLERGRAVLCVEVAAQGRQFWELNNPEDVPRIEAMMQEMGMG